MLNLCQRIAIRGVVYYSLNLVKAIEKILLIDDGGYTFESNELEISTKHFAGNDIKLSKINRDIRE
jgi:hypothetical protein